MSEVKVNKISPRSGTDVTLGDSGDTFTVPTGVTLDTSNSTVTLPDGSVANAKLANSSITLNGNSVSLGGSASIASGMFRNIIINGDMSIAQRGTSQASITSTQYLLDRHLFNIVGQGTWTMSQDTDVPSGQGFYNSFKLACTTADASPAASDYLQYQQRFEGQMLQYIKKGTANAESLTLSFWVKSNKTGTYIAELYDFDNTRQISKSYTIDSADTWEKKTITFAGDTTGTLDNNNIRSFDVNLFFGAGSDRSSGTLNTSWGSNVQANRAVGQVNLADSTANYINITGVQLEVGSAASDFEFLPFDVNLTRCERYYEKTYNLSVVPGTSSDPGKIRDSQSSDVASNAVALRNYKVRKRATATLTFYTGTTSGSVSYARSGASGTSTVNTWSQNGENSYAAYFGVGASFSNVYIEYHLVADAEL